MTSTSAQGTSLDKGHPTTGDIEARSKLPHSLQSIVVGLARTFDFNNVLAHRTVTRSAEEDMILAWREVYAGLPPLDEQGPNSDQGSSPSGLKEFAEPAHTTEAGAQPPQVIPFEKSARRAGPSMEHLSIQPPPASYDYEEEVGEIGYRGPTACAAAGITYRQLDYWARTGLVEPSVRVAEGSGSQRLYSFRDILRLKVVKRLLDAGIPLAEIHTAVRPLEYLSTQDLLRVTLMSDGTNVYECRSPDEIVGLLASGQGVFGIALGRVWQEVAGELTDLPAVRAEDGLIVSGAEDLAVRSSIA